MEPSLTPPIDNHSPYSPFRTSAELNSITTSVWSMSSRAHSSRSSVSSVSMTSSPILPRESFDLYGSTKRLEDVREEPLEREDDGEHSGYNVLHLPANDTVVSPNVPDRSLPMQLEYSLGDQDTWSTTSSGKHPFKRARSTNSRNSISDRVATRIGSISRRWKTRSLAESQLSVITSNHHSRRSSSANSTQILTPALNAISKHESCLPGSPLQTSMDGVVLESAIVPLYMDDPEREREREWDEEWNEGQATTPLLPPTLVELSGKRDQPLQSPLQSPAMAPTVCIGNKRTSVDNNGGYLPSPPLSARPSMASLPRSSSALQNDVPPLTLYEEPSDAWDDRLGHANFQIYPEPYLPESFDMGSYREFRANWDLARKQYAQHIARTTEHYGDTSRVYKFTQQKWEEIDNAWKHNDNIISAAISQSSGHTSDDPGSPTSASSPVTLEKPLTRIVVPSFRQSGKFPNIGDADIVGPLTMAPARAPELQRRSEASPPSSPKKRNLFKYLSDVLGRHNNVLK